MDQKQHTVKITQTKNVHDRSIPFIKKKKFQLITNLSGPDTDSKHTKNQVFKLHNPLDNIPLSKLEIDNIQNIYQIQRN